MKRLALFTGFAFLCANLWWVAACAAAPSESDTSGFGGNFFKNPGPQEKKRKNKDGGKKKKKGDDEEEKPKEEEGKKEDGKKEDGKKEGAGGGGGAGGSGLVDDGNPGANAPPKGGGGGNMPPKLGPAGGGGGSGRANPAGGGGGNSGGANKPGGDTKGSGKAGGGGGNIDYANHPVKWKTDLSEAIKESSVSNKPVFACFYSPVTDEKQNILTTTFKDKDLAKYINANFVPVLINMDEQPAAVKEYGIKKAPEVVFITSDGKSAEQISGWYDAQTYTAEIKKRQSKVAEHKTAANSEKAKKKVEEADEAFGQTKYTVALGLYKAASALEPKGKLGDKARSRMEEIEKLANDKLVQAKELIDSRDFLEASKSLPDIVSLFSGTRAAVEADQIARQLENDALAKHSIRASKAKQAYSQYILDLKGGRMGAALDRLRNITKTYKDVQDIRETALAELKRFEGNENKMKMVRDEAAAPQCKIWRAQAKTYAKNERPQKAREIYQKIIDVFPGTSYADEAALEMSLVAR